MTDAPTPGSVWSCRKGDHAGFRVRVVRVTSAGNVVFRVVRCGHGSRSSDGRTNRQMIVPGKLFGINYERER